MLRKRIGYRGIIFSDDLEMGGILKFMPIEEAAVAAIRAGMDLLEICHSPELILRAYEALIAEGRAVGGFSHAAAQASEADRAATRQAVRGRRSGSAAGAAVRGAASQNSCASAKSIRNAQPDPQEAQPA